MRRKVQQLYSFLFYLFSNVVSTQKIFLIIITSLSYLRCFHGALCVGKCQSTVRFSCFCSLLSGQFECQYSRISVVSIVFGMYESSYRISHKIRLYALSLTAKKMRFSIKDFFSRLHQIRSFLRIWSHLLKKSLMENMIFWAVLTV